MSAPDTSPDTQPDMSKAEEQAELFEVSPELDAMLGELSAMSEAERNELKARWPQALIDVAAVVEAALRKRLPENAGPLTDDVVLALAHFMGGRMFYLPRDDRMKTALRNRRMWQQYCHQRCSVEKLARTYELTIVQVYNIIAAQRLLHRRKIQPDLFPASLTKTL